MRILRLAFLAIALCATAVPGAGDLPLRSLERPRFVLDAVALPQGADSARVELIWRIPFPELTFREDERYFRAHYDVAVVLTRADQQVAGDVWERRVRVKSFSETRDSRLAKGKQVLVVPTGAYDVRATVTDRTSHAASTAASKLSAVFGPSRIGLSDLRFLRYTEDGSVSSPGREVPVGEGGHVARITLHPELSEGGTFQVKWWFRAPSGREILARDSTVTLGSEPYPFEFPIPTEKLSVGTHRLEIRLEGEGGGTEESRHSTFFVRLTPEWFLIHREEALEVLDFLAESAEMRALRESKGPDWPIAVEQFWARNDPTPGAATNEFRDLVQERMEAAATLFDEPFRRPGWRTDRGRILLKFGRPDRRTVRVADFEGPASELWEYDSPRRLFFFVDERGSGELWLRG